MKFAYKFSNLLGTVYHKGNLTFTPDDNRLLSPVGNRITAFDLKQNKSQTLPLEAHKSFDLIALSPDGIILLAITEDGEALLISLISKSVLHRHRFNRKILDIKFSPNGKRFAVTFDNNVQIFTAPGQRSADFNPFHLERVLFGSQDDTTYLDWTDDSSVLAVGGKDMNTRIYAMESCPNLGVYSLGGHNDAIAACFFSKKSLNLATLSKNGQLCVWECDTSLEKLWEPIHMDESDGSASELEKNAEQNVDQEKMKKKNRISYSRRDRHYYRELTKDQAVVTSACYHQGTKILVVAFSNGFFFLHELPDFIMLHSLSLGEQSITAATFNRVGDWLALGTSELGQLVVWEWQSQCFVLKQQGHYDQLLALEYSPDGQFLATGGADGKVKLWNTSSGFCFVTFTEHTAAITSVKVAQSGKAVISSSLDGTVRAFDTTRYRNFRTFTSPRPVQFSCLSVDSSGEVVCAGSQDSFEIFVWSMKNGHLMEILSGHEAPISGLTFGNCGANQLLVSSSWDESVRVWDIFKSKVQQETIRIHSEVLAVAFRPDGSEVAVCALNCTIQFYEPLSAQQVGLIEAKTDLGRFRRETDMVSAKTASQGRSFTTLCYSADGSWILVGGQSKYICIYHVKEQVLLRRFEVSKNWSFTGLTEFLSKRTDTEFGARALMDLDEDDSERRTLSLPGVKTGDMASRHFKPEIKVYSVQFSPTGQSWAACTTEGLLMYSTHTDELFDPFDLDPSITPESVKSLLHTRPCDYARAVIMAVRLNELNLTTEAVESVPVAEIPLISHAVGERYAILLLEFCALQLDRSRHLEFYLTWIQTLLFEYGAKLKASSASIMPLLHLLQKALVRKKEDFLKLAQRNASSLRYAEVLAQLAQTSRSSAATESVMEPDE